MGRKYGIFLANGVNTPFANMGSHGLSKLNTPNFDTMEEAEAYIENTETLPAGREYQILEFTGYLKKG